METLLSILVGIGLSAACGFRVFVPMLIVSAAAWMGWLPLSADFQWLGTLPALIAFAVATVVEVAAYYVPWVDNALDALAIIAGGGTAATVQSFTTVARAGSSVVSLGFLNPLFATVELIGATGLAVLVIALPIAGLLVAGGVIWLLVRIVRRCRRPTSSSSPA